MLIPANEQLPEIIRGGTWEIELELWSDTGHTIPFSLVGYTVNLEIIGVKNLTSGSGLTISASEGKITAQLSATETAAIAAAEAKYYLKIEKAGTVIFPVHGSVPIVSP